MEKTYIFLEKVISMASVPLVLQLKTKKIPSLYWHDMPCKPTWYIVIKQEISLLAVAGCQKK